MDEIVDITGVETELGVGSLAVSASVNVAIVGVGATMSIPPRLRTSTTNLSPQQDITFLKVAPSQTGLMS